MDIDAVDRLRSEFPIGDRYIYLDHAGIAPISGRACSAVREAAERLSRDAAFAYPWVSMKIEQARASCAELLDAEQEEIAFIRSTSHGISLVANGLPWKTGENVVVCDGDFPSNRFPWEHLERKGVERRIVPAIGGRWEADEVVSRIDGRTQVVAVSSVNFVSGYRIDLQRIGTVCRERGVLFCVDAIQSAGIVPMSVRELGIDFLSADGHKWLLGPEGVGIFFCRNGLAERLDPVLIGWKSVTEPFSFEKPNLDLRKDAQRFEEGSQNALGIIGLGASVQLLLEVGIEQVCTRVLDLGDVIIHEAERRGFEVITPKERAERGGAVTFRGPFDPDRIRTRLRENGIMVNTRGGGLRVSPHMYNTEGELERLFGAIDEERDAARQDA